MEISYAGFPRSAASCPLGGWAEPGREVAREAPAAGQGVNNVRVSITTTALLSDKQRAVLWIESCLLQIHMLMS